MRLIFELVDKVISSQMSLIHSIEDLNGTKRLNKKREFLLPDCLQGEISLLSHFGLGVKHWLFLDLKPADFWTSAVSLLLFSG